MKLQKPLLASLLFVFSLQAENLLLNQGGTTVASGDWVDLTSSVTGLTGTTFPFYVTGWDKYFYVPALRAMCGIGSYYELSSEPNRNMSCYSFQENRWWMQDMAGSWHNEHLQEGGHPMGNFLVDPATSVGLGFQGSSGSQVQNQTKWGMWRYDFVGQVGIPQMPQMGVTASNQLGTAAYDPFRSLMIGFGGDSSSQGHYQYDNNASHSTVTNVGYNAYNTWSLEMAVTLNSLPVSIENTSIAVNTNSTLTYLFGGFASAANHNWVWTYTPGAAGAPGTWTNVFADATTSASCHDAQGGNNCPSARSLPSFAFDATDNIFLMTGGTLNNTAPLTGILNDTWVFDPVALTWIQVLTAPWNGSTAHVLGYNEFTSTLNGGISSGATTFTIGTLGNSTSPATLQIDGEFFYCTTLTGNTYSGCTPGFENTTQAAHSNGATVYQGIEPSGPNERLTWMPEDNVFLLFSQPNGNHNPHMIAFRYNAGGNAGYLSKSYSYTAADQSVGPLNRNTTDAADQGWAYSEAIASDGTSAYVVHAETATTQVGASPANSWLLHPYAQKFSVGSSCGTLDTNFTCLGSAYSSMSPDVGGNPRQAFDVSCTVISGVPWCYWHEEDASLLEYAYAKGWDGSGWNLGGNLPKVSAGAAYDGPGQIISVGGTPTVIHQEQDRSAGGGNGNPYEVYCYVRQWNGTSWIVVGGTALNTGYSVCDGASIATDGTNIWASFTLYNPLAIAGAGKNGTFFGPPQVQLWFWNGSTWTQQGTSGNVLGTGCTGAIVNGTPPAYTGTSCSRAFSTSLTVLGGVPYVAFVERTDQGILQKLWVRKYSSGWSTVGAAFLNKDQLNGWAFRPELTNDGTNLQITWDEQGNPQTWVGTFAYPANVAYAQKPHVYAATLTTGGTLTYLGGALNVDTTAGAATHPSITILSGRPTVTWGEVKTGSTRQVYAKQWNGTDWGAIGSAPPCTIAITSPANNATVSGPTTLTVSTSNCSTLARVEYRWNGYRLVGDNTWPNSFSNTPPYSLAYNVSFNWDGTHKLTAIAMDAQGNTLATSSPITLIINDRLIATTPGQGLVQTAGTDFTTTVSGTVSLTLGANITASNNPPVASLVSTTNIIQYCEWDGKLWFQQFVSSSGFNQTFDTTTLENGTHDLNCVMRTEDSAGHNPSVQPIFQWERQVNVQNTNHARELTLGFSTCYLWLGGTATCTLTPTILNDDNTTSGTTASFVSGTTSVATVTGGTVASATVTGLTVGQSIVTATSGSLTATARILVYSGTPNFPHFCYDGGIATAYNSGNCAPNKSTLVRSVFGSGPNFTQNISVAPLYVASGMNVFENSSYVSPTDCGNQTGLAWINNCLPNVTGQANQWLAAGPFRSFLGLGKNMEADGVEMQWSADTDFSNRIAATVSALGGKMVAWEGIDEDPLEYPRVMGNGVIGAVNGPTAFVCNGSTCTVTWPAYTERGGHNGDVAGADNPCLNAVNIPIATSPPSYASSCPAGTYAPSGGTFVEAHAQVLMFNEYAPGCPPTGCQHNGPLFIPVPNTVRTNIISVLESQTHPIYYSHPLVGGSSLKDLTNVNGVIDGVRVAGYGSIYLQYSADKLKETGSVWDDLSNLETSFYGNAWAAMDKTRPYSVLMTAMSTWFHSGGPSFTLGATTGAVFNTTAPNNAVVSGKITTSGTATCNGNFDIASVQSSTQFTVSQAAGCSGSGGTVIISTNALTYAPPYDFRHSDDAGNRAGANIAAQYWDGVILGAAMERVYNMNLGSTMTPQYPLPLANLWVPQGANENGQQGLGIGSTGVGIASAPDRWNGSTYAFRSIGRLEPYVLQPSCNAPYVNSHIHAGAKCGAAGNLVILISDVEGSPNTVTFPYGSFKLGSGPITRYRIQNGLDIRVDTLSGAGVSDSFVADGAETVLYFFPSDNTSLAANYTFSANLPAGATQAVFRAGLINSAANLAQQIGPSSAVGPTGVLCTATCTATLDLNLGAYYYTLQYLDSGGVSLSTTAPVAFPLGIPTISTTSPLPAGSVNIAYSDTLIASGSTPITWTVTSGTLPSGLTINSSTGTISGTPTALGTFNFTIAATNSIGTNSKAFILSIGGNAPVITTASPLPAATLNLAYSTTVAATGTSPITWSVTSGTLPNGLTLNASTGVISGTPTVPATFSFTLTATNTVGSGSKTFSLTVNAPPLITTTSPLPAGTQNAAYSTTLAASGTTPIIWSVTAGTLPTGLSLNASTGVISGTPTVVATSSFTIKATNAQGTNSVAFSLTINGVAPVITTATPLPAATQGIAYSTTLAATGTTPISWSLTLGSLPAGLSLAPSTGIISGTPTALGTSNFTVTATNVSGSNAKAFSLTINGTAPVITTASPLPAATQTIAYSTTLAATGSSPITWSITVGSLPGGLSLSSSTGTISGVPTGSPGPTSFTVKATNAAGSNSKAFSLTVNAVAPIITTSSPLPAGTLSAAYSTTLAASGTTPITWALTVGTLPTGLSLNTSTGVISGTPSATGTSSFTISATNAGGSFSKPFSLTINGVPPTITTPATLPQATQGTAYSTTISATGSTPITWSITSGTLPTGLSLGSSTGIISGTPTGTGTSAFTILATNGAGTYAQAFSLTVIPTVVAPTITTTSPLPNGNVNVFYSTALLATGTQPITWSVTAGSLPTGLSLNSSTGLISGTPTTISSNSFTIQALNSAGSNSVAFTLAITTGGTSISGSVILSGNVVVH